MSCLDRPRSRYPHTPLPVLVLPPTTRLPLINCFSSIVSRLLCLLSCPTCLACLACFAASLPTKAALSPAFIRRLSLARVELEHVAFACLFRLSSFSSSLPYSYGPESLRHRGLIQAAPIPPHFRLQTVLSATCRRKFPCSLQALTLLFISPNHARHRAACTARPNADSPRQAPQVTQGRELERRRCIVHRLLIGRLAWTS